MNNISEKIKCVLKKSTNIPFGFCKYSEVGNMLLKNSSYNKLPENPKSIILFLLPYYFPILKGNISIYARGIDYHKFASNFLKNIISKLESVAPLAKFVGFCDHSPIPEVRAAALAGLGIIGQNGLLINERFGSFVFICEIVTTEELNFEPFTIQFCEGCNKCLSECPGSAINLDSESHFNKENCASHISQKKGDLNTIEEEILIKSKSIWGCDICQTVCPHNLDIEKGIIELAPKIAALLKTDLEDDNLFDFNDYAFYWRGKEPLLRNINILKT